MPSDGAEVNGVSLPADFLEEFTSGLLAISADFVEQVGSRPTLGELLEILGWAAPAQSEFVTDALAVPLKFKAKAKGNRRYEEGRDSRVGELNDSVFVGAADLLASLAESSAAVHRQPVSASVFASSVALALKASAIPLLDANSKDVLSLAVDLPKRKRKPRIGDTLSIPAKGSGYHLAVILARNAFGTALGLFLGTFPLPRVVAADRDAVLPHPVYTDEHLIGSGLWNIVGHNDDLLELFPAKPEIYHAPDLTVPGVELGEFGAAETADGEMRLLGAYEARDVGLTDGTYQQGYVGEELQRLLDDGFAGPASAT
ncbi:hypothetical protein [Streptomyces sp. SYSU K21746]